MGGVCVPMYIYIYCFILCVLYECCDGVTVVLVVVVVYYTLCNVPTAERPLSFF